MAIKPIHAKTILSRMADPNGWFGARINASFVPRQLDLFRKV